MSAKVAAILSKADQERRRGDYRKALNRIDGGIKDFADDILLYREAIDVCLETGESLRAAGYLRAAQRHVPDSAGEIWRFCLDKTASFNDPILCKSMVDMAIKRRDLESAATALEQLKDHTAEELLQRTRTKRQSLNAAGGGSFASELAANSLAEALLCVRSKRFQDAARAFVRILDDKPVEHEVLTPYLTILQRQYPQKGGIIYALGCSRLASGDHQKGLLMIVQGVSLAPTNAQDAIRRIEGLRDVDGIPRVKIDLAVAKLTILRGEINAAAEKLGALLKNGGKKARDIIDLLEPHVEQVGNNNNKLNYLYIDAAMFAGDARRAADQIRNIYHDRRCRRDLLSWLDVKSQEKHMLADVLFLYGDLALQQQMFEKAVEVFRNFVSRVPHEAARVKDLLYPHQKNTFVNALYNDLSTPEAEVESSGDGFSIEHYGGSDFTLRGGERASDPNDTWSEGSRGDWEAEVAAIRHDRPDERSDFDDYVGATNDTGGSRAGHSGVFEKESVLDLGAGAEPQDPDTPDSETPGPEPPSAEELEREAAILDEEEEPWLPEEKIEIGSPADDTTLLAESDIPASAEKVGERDAAAESRPASFADRYHTFEKGDLSNDEIIELIEVAASLERMHEMKELLNFVPETVAQETRRKYYLADYYLHEDQPVAALVILRTVSINGLGKEERKAFLLKNAFCYQQLNRYEAAQSVYLRMVSEFPDFEVAEHMAKINYERHLRSSVAGVTALQKTSSLRTIAKDEEEQ